jgi:glucose-6-phosphate-specific signal transduction histidine kinase
MALYDAGLLAAAVTIFFALAAHLDLSERLALWASGYEQWQLDEIPLTLLTLSVGLAWFAWRRWRDLDVALKAREQAEEVNLRMLAQNRLLTQRLMQTQEHERANLAREIHDEVGQCCVAIRVDAASIEEETRDRIPAAHESACAITHTAEHLHDVVRGMLQQLRPMGLDDLGLLTSLKLLIQTWERRHRIACSFDSSVLPTDLSPMVKVALYRTVQESLTNIAQHARASRVSVVVNGPLERQAARIQLIIEDDGTGIPQKALPRGLGIIGMRERICALGGELVIDRASWGGVRIAVVLPLRDQDALTPA